MADLMQAPDWPVIPDSLMSNADHEVDEAVAQRLKDETVIAIYPGWNFNAECWWCDGLYYAAVFVFHVHQATLSAPTPKELMVLVSDRFGWE